MAERSPAIAEQLKILARDVRRIGDGYRHDPETIAMQKDDVAKRLTVLVRKFRASRSEAGKVSDPAMALPINDVSRWIDADPAPFIWLLDGLIPLGSVVLLTGRGGAGKTSLAQLVATHVAAGTGQMFGRDMVCGRAVCMMLEDSDDVLHQRHDRICAAHGIDETRLAGRLYITGLHDDDCIMWSENRETDQLLTLETRLAFYKDLRLLVIDNASLVTDDEIDRSSVARFLRRLGAFANAKRCTVILIAHPSKSHQDDSLYVTSGSTAWVNQARAVLELTQDGESLALKVVKANYGKTGTIINLEWHNGAIIEERRGSTLEEHAHGSRVERLIVEEVRKAWEAGVPLTSTPQAGDRYLPRFMSNVHGLRAEEVRAWSARMVSAGRIAIAQVNPSKRDSPSGFYVVEDAKR